MLISNYQLAISYRQIKPNKINACIIDKQDILYTITTIIENATIKKDQSVI